jgi:hypothetical protein
MVYLTVDVDVDMNEFDDQELIDELERRGWFVGPEKNWEPIEGLTDDEMDYIVSMLIHAIPGTFAYEIYEKLRKR